MAERERNGPFADLGDLAARAGVRRLTLEQLAWSGACDSLIGGLDTQAGAGRRSALWQLGLAAPALRIGGEPRAPASQSTQLALPLELPGRAEPAPARAAGSG